MFVATFLNKSGKNLYWLPRQFQAQKLMTDQQAVVCLMGSCTSTSSSKTFVIWDIQIEELILILGSQMSVRKDVYFCQKVNQSFQQIQNQMQSEKEFIQWTQISNSYSFLCDL
jgi:hypothetical protein